MSPCICYISIKITYLFNLTKSKLKLTLQDEIETKTEINYNTKTTLTVRSMHWFSMMAPQQPKNPMIRMRTPVTMQSTEAPRKLMLGITDA